MVRAFTIFVAAVLATTMARAIESSTADLTVVVAARAVQPGEVVRIAVSCACSDPLDRVTGEAFGRQITFLQTEQEWRALVGIDLGTRPGAHTVAITASANGLPALMTEHTLHVVAKAFATRRLRVDPRFVQLRESELERIAQEAERIDALIQKVSSRAWDGMLRRPAAGTATSNFGARSIYNGQLRAPHAGIDLLAPQGTAVTAPSAGDVVLAEELFFTGNTVVIDHGQGLYSLLAHLSRFAVNVGDEVTPGAAVGYVGATGRVTGPHLHWAVRLNGARVDPLSVVALAERQGLTPLQNP